MLEGGEYGSIEELARAEEINPSYLARVLRLTLLAPEIVESILDGRHDPERITLAEACEAVPGGVERPATQFIISGFANRSAVGQNLLPHIRYGVLAGSRSRA